MAQSSVFAPHSKESCSHVVSRGPSIKIANANPSISKIYETSSARTTEDEQETIKRQNVQLAQLKEQFLKLRTQYHQEKKDASVQALSLQRQLRTEQKRVEALESEIIALSGSETAGGRSGSIEVVEKIWKVMRGYRDFMRNGNEVAAKAEDYALRPSSSVRTNEYRDELPQIEEGNEEVFTQPKAERKSPRGHSIAHTTPFDFE